MNILAIGDVVGHPGTDFVEMCLRGIIEDYNIDFTILNGENTATGSGITKKHVERFFDAGADVITMGNHTFGKKDIFDIMEENVSVLRPANYPIDKGNESVICTVGNKKVGVLNLLGRVNLINADCPFRCADRIIDEMKDKADIIMVDFHAEATSEKIAMGYYLDGRVSGVFGTHTHVQTADETVLPKGTGYITDIGMSGVINSVLGVKKEIILERFLTSVPQKFENADGKCRICGAVFEIDDDNKCKSVKRIAVE